MATGEIHVGDVGTLFRVTIKDEDEEIVDISTATTKSIFLRKPDHVRTVLTKTATLVTDGTDGQMEYESIVTDLDIAGGWNIQGYVVIPYSGEWKSDIGSFRVYPNLA